MFGYGRNLAYGQFGSYVDLRAFTDLVEQATAWGAMNPV
jgi:hypothetical protein